MLIFVPMSGLGSRYIRAGYTAPKPLINVDGKYMIEHVLDMFPKHYPCLFTVNRQHAEETDLCEVLRKIRPGCQIHVIDVHRDGPVRTVVETEHLIPDDEPLIVSYCDMGCTWDYWDFERWLDDGSFDAAWTCYKGFHPSLLGPTQNARCRWEGDRVLEIREKHQFTDDRMQEYTSSGVHYFRRGSDLKKFSHQLMQSGDRVQNEFFVSVVLQLQVEAGQKVGVYGLERFFQFGTPQDLRDYESWARAMRALDGFTEALSETRTEAQMVVPMAGLGKRFSDVGYKDPKPLIQVAGATMIEQTLRMLPKPSQRVLVARSEHSTTEAFKATLASTDPTPQVITLDRVTEGQAITAQIGVKEVDPNRPVLIPPCDAGYVYNLEEWARLENEPSTDCIVWCARNHLPSIWYPALSGWIHADPKTGDAKAMAVKKLVDDVPIEEQFPLTGTFWFRTGQVFLDGVDELVESGERVNNEWYIDTVAKRMIERGMSVKAFIVDKFMPWGTPNELKTFFYWNDVHRGGRPIKSGGALASGGGGFGGEASRSSGAPQTSTVTNGEGRAVSPTKSIVIPCYNEEENIPLLLEAFDPLYEPGSDWELVLVNNGSTDGSAEVFERELGKAGRSYARVVTVPSPNVGYGHGIKTGLRAARGRRLAWTHADGQTPPSDVLAAFEILERSARPEQTFVKGRRVNRAPADKLFTFGMTVAATTFLGEELSDINAQPKCFDRSLLELAGDDAPDDLSLDLYFFWLARRYDYEIRTFDVSFLERAAGESKWATDFRSRYKSIERTLKYMAELSKR